MVILYNIFWFVGILLGFPLIVIHVLVSEKRRKTFPYRIGIKPLPVEIIEMRSHCRKNKPLWVHALSVGEVLSAVSLVKGLRQNFKHHDVYFSVSTQTGFEIARERLNKDVDAIFFFPYDFFFSVRHIVQSVEPDLVVMVETDVWPNFIDRLKRENIPVVLVNARLSDKSFRNFKRFFHFSKELFSSFTKICTQSKQDADRFISLGVPHAQVVVTGNIKFDQECRSISKKEKNTLRKRLQIEPGAKVFIAGSTHNGEEAMFRDVFIRLKMRFSDLILIIAPRNPKRAQSVQRLFSAEGIEPTFVAEIKGLQPDESSDVLIVNRIGLLDRLYALADIAFVGGSLVAAGGHNPLEPAAYSLPILFGPDMSDFKPISQMLVSAGGALEIKDQGELFRAVVEIFENDQKASDMGMRAFDVFCYKQGAVEQTIQVIKREGRLG